MELRNLMEQHKFIKDLDADFPNRAQLLREISQKIVASPKDSFWDGEKCPICLGGFEPEHVVVLGFRVLRRVCFGLPKFCLSAKLL